MKYGWGLFDGAIAVECLRNIGNALYYHDEARLALALGPTALYLLFTIYRWD